MNYYDLSFSMKNINIYTSASKMAQYENHFSFLVDNCHQMIMRKLKLNELDK